MLLLSAVVVSHAPAQTAQEHAAHHPPGDSVVSRRATPPPRAAKPAPDMMAQMGATPAPEVIPTLMRLPALTAEDRAELARMAAERMQDGTARLAAGIGRLAAAEEEARYADMTAALDEARHGLALMESAVSARAALDSQDAPALIAERWLRSTMTLPNATAPLGWQRDFSPFHIVTMTILFLFSATMLVIHYRRMRAVESLLAGTARALPGASPGSAKA